MSSAAVCAASIMETHYSKVDNVDSYGEDDILDTGFVNYSEDAIYENEQNVLTAHMSSKLDAKLVEDGNTNIPEEYDIHTTKAFEIHKIVILSNHIKQNRKAKAYQEQFDLSHVSIKSFHTKSVVPSLFCVDMHLDHA